MSGGSKPATAFKTAARRIFLTATDENNTSEKTQEGALSNLVALAVRPFDGPHPHAHADIGFSVCGTFRDTEGKCKSEGRIWAAGWEGPVTEVEIYGNPRWLVATAHWDMIEQETDVYQSWLALLGCRFEHKNNNNCLNRSGIFYCKNALNIQTIPKCIFAHHKVSDDLRYSSLNRLCVLSFCLSSLWSYPA